MSAFHKSLGAVLSIALLAFALRSQDGAGPKLAENFRVDDAVESVEVKIALDKGGGDLTEPVALDLGLGFPLWLQPVGRKEGESAPFGAIPQQATAKGTIAAGSDATFTFAINGEPGQDTFQTTPQLLAGVRVSDISRVGFTATGNADWAFESYEIAVNGKPFAAGKASANRAADAPARTLVKPNQAREAALRKMADIGPKISVLESNRSELAELAATGLASADDAKNLKDINRSYTPLAIERRRLEGQLAGIYPWFEEGKFNSPWRDSAQVKSARVTIVTETHSAADTQNYVYFRTGGHSYVLGSPANPLYGTDGPQVFALDLSAGPLVQADLRGYALGMLGQPKPFGIAPDRWHPQRLVVEIDGKVVYDTEEVDLDRRSLQAIRLIPPVHMEGDGKSVTNAPISRETFLWKSGEGMGLNPDTKEPLPLPDSKDPTYPKPEAESPPSDPAATKTEDAKPDDPKPDDPKPDDPKPDDPKDPTPPGAKDPNASGTADSATNGPGQFPGEKGMDPGSGGGAVPSTDGGGVSGGSPSSPSDGGGGGGSSPSGDGGGTAGGYTPPGSGGAGTMPAGNALPAGSVPAPVGKPIQICQVRIASGYKADDTFSVTWTISGDESAVDHYVVSLMPIRPEKTIPDAESVYATVSQPRGSRSATLTIPPGAANGDYFLAPTVTAMPVAAVAPANPAAPPIPDPNAPAPAGGPNTPPSSPPLPVSDPTPHLKKGLTRMLFPAGTNWNPSAQPALGGGPPLAGLRTTFAYQNPVPGPFTTQLLSGSPPKKSGRGVWAAGALVSDSGIQFEAAGRGCHVGLQPLNGDATQVFLKVNLWSGSPRRMVAHLGFLGGTGATGSATAKLERNWLNAAGAPLTGYVPLGNSTTSVAGDPMPSPLAGNLSMNSAPAGAAFIGIRATVSGGPFDPAHSPVLIGVRVIPQ